MNKRILTLQDFSSIGRCSLTAAIPIIFASGNEAVAMPTSHFSTQTAIDGFTFFDLSQCILPTYNHFNLLKIKFDCLLTGFLGSHNSIDAAIEIAKDFKKKNIMVAIDPAMADNGKLYSVFDKSYYEKMLKLVDLADLLLPNFTEGKMLAGIDLPLTPSKENATMILQILKDKGHNQVVLSGIEDGNLCGAAVLCNNKISFVFNQKFNENIHGAGDILSSVIVSSLQNGLDLIKSAKLGVDFVFEAIKSTLNKQCDLKLGLNIEDCLHLLINNFANQQ